MFTASNAALALVRRTSPTGSQHGRPLARKNPRAAQVLGLSYSRRCCVRALIWKVVHPVATRHCIKMAEDIRGTAMDDRTVKSLETAFRGLPLRRRQKPLGVLISPLPDRQS
jgi:hypothetical protein